MVAHTYATVAEANDYIKSGGAVTFAAELAPAVALKLAILESVSRAIDGRAQRSTFGSSFGPRIGTNKYDGGRRGRNNELWLDDDLLAITSITLNPLTASSTTYTPVLDTDYYLANADGYTGPPWRKIILHGFGTPAYFGYGYRVSALTGSWGYSDVTIPTGTTVASGLSVGTTQTTFVTSSTPALSPGMTLLIDSEQIYLYALSGTTATVVRGCNGTTAATHADSSTISRYQYDSRVHDVALRLFMRRWKARDAGADGTSGGLDVPGQTTLEGEDTIIRRGIGDLIFPSVG
jgi:hypothetical protein